MQIRPEGLYVEPANLFIDPVRSVERAIVSHGHADHARPGHAKVLATSETLQIMATRFGANAFGEGQALALGEVIEINGVRFFLAPAGHVLGSAQIAIEYAGNRVVYSGDYKPRSDATCANFEPVPCDVFITEATFGLPVFRHPPTGTEMAKVLQSLSVFPDRCHVIGAYALGKAQRVLKELRLAGYDRPIYLHGALEALSRLYQDHGVDLGDLKPATAGQKGKPRADLAGEIVLAPPSAIADRWARRLPDPVVAMASGWMTVKQRAKQRGVELPLVISDHADWDELLETCAATGAGEVWVTHGREEALVHALQSKGVRARALSMIGYDEEGE